MVPHCVVFLLVWVIVFLAPMAYGMVFRSASMPMGREPFPGSILPPNRRSSAREGRCVDARATVPVSDFLGGTVQVPSSTRVHTFSQAAPATLPCFCLSMISKLATPSPLLNDTRVRRYLCCAPLAPVSRLYPLHGLGHNTVKYYTCKRRIIKDISGNPPPGLLIFFFLSS